MKQPNAPTRPAIIAAYAAVYIIWGSTYLGILYAIQTIPPFLMIAMRFLVAGGLLLGWCLLRGEKLPDRKSIGMLALAGVLMLAIGNGAVTWVEQFLPSGLAAIIVATVPLWFVLLDRKQWAYNFSNKGIIIGLLMGFAGVMLLFAGKSSAAITGSSVKIISFFVLIAGTISWAAGSLFSKYKHTGGTTSMKAALQMLSAGIATLSVALLSSEQRDFSFSQVSGTSWLALAYLIVMGSLVAYLAYIWLLGVQPASLVGTYAYVNPVVAVFLGWLLVNEAMTKQQGIALGIILAGVVLVNMAKEKKSTEATVKKELGNSSREGGIATEI
jgi:drug/metabolite transporter (DMT)-like permease